MKYIFEKKNYVVLNPRHEFAFTRKIHQGLEHRIFHAFWLKQKLCKFIVVVKRVK